MDYQQQVLQAIQNLGAQNAVITAELSDIKLQNTEIRQQNVEIRQQNVEIKEQNLILKSEIVDVKERLQRIEENTIIIRDRVLSQFQNITPETKAAIEQAAARLIEDKIEERIEELKTRAQWEKRCPGVYEATAKERQNGFVIPMTKLFNSDKLLSEYGNAERVNGMRWLNGLLEQAFNIRFRGGILFNFEEFSKACFTYYYSERQFIRK